MGYVGYTSEPRREKSRGADHRVELITIQNGRTTIPEDFKDLLESTALAHVATSGPRGEPQRNPDPDQIHRPGDERVVVFVRGEHTTQKGG